MITPQILTPALSLATAFYVLWPGPFLRFWLQILVFAYLFFQFLEWGVAKALNDVPPDDFPP